MNIALRFFGRYCSSSFGRASFTLQASAKAEWAMGGANERAHQITVLVGLCR
ncbi:MAG: hypothetical protein JKY96_06655 [Phycisphaerales bacterium]|nr:hypothetical protein [Phycisphaerales bacterium]